MAFFITLPDILLNHENKCAMKCERCHTEIKPENINIQKDTAYCHSCHNVFSISQSLNSEEKLLAELDTDYPPKRVIFEKRSRETIVRASTKSPIGYFFLIFMVIWTSLTVGAIYGDQISSGRFDLLSSLIGIPFLAFSLIFWAATAMLLAGKVELRFDRTGGKVFVGVMNYGWRKEFSWVFVDKIEIKTTIGQKGRRQRRIQFYGTDKLSFGTLLNSEQLDFFYAVLKKAYKATAMLG